MSEPQEALRTVKAQEVTADPRIVFKDGVWTVPSQAGGSVRYTVNPSQANPSCTCDDFALRGAVRVCKHIEAVRLLLERQAKGEPVPVAPPRPARQTYKQHWPEYNAAQENEKDHFQELLFDLCSAIPQPPRKNDGQNGGRKPVRLGDAVFAAVFKVWSTLSARRFMSDLREAHRRGYLGRMLSYNPLFKCLESPEATPILRDLIVRSSLPLRSVETVFAPDSSGFGTSKYLKWFDEKYGVERAKCAWVKAHVCAGVKTGVITAAVIGDKDAGDSPQFPELINTTAENFTVKEVPADKAYLSYDNLDLVESHGGVAYIPFKSNSVLGGTPLWDKMFHYFNLHREEFLKHYHARSNVESVFSAVKRKYGDSVRSRTEPAMVNEVLCKLVCHNLSCVIHAWYELGIDPRDWGMSKREPIAEAEPPATLRFPGRPESKI
jgi:Transposase DDE domain